MVRLKELFKANIVLAFVISMIQCIKCELAIELYRK